MTNRPHTTVTTVTLGGLLRRFKGRVAVTVTLVLVEAIVLLLFPLFIGLAIDGLLQDELDGVMALGALAVGALVVGSARRLLDTRAYSAIYEVTATEVAAGERRRETPVSTVAARTTLLNEFDEFLENSMPNIVNSLIGIVGTLAILAGIHLGVFVAALGLAVLVAIVYGVTGRWNFSLTASYNDELERQVDALQADDAAAASRHFGRLMTWNRKLSDLETLNFSLIYLGVIALLLYSPIAVVDSASPEYGFVFAAIMYVFQYIDAVLEMPLFIQQLIRLNEISSRLRSGEPAPVPAPAADLSG